MRVAVKNPRKIESKESRRRQKLRAESIFFQQRRTRLQKGQNSAPESQRVSSLQEPPMKTRMTPKYRARKYDKVTAQITKLTAQMNGCSKNKASLFEKMEAPWRDAHNADPGRKKERILTELAGLTVTKTHPICGLW
jgi:uncharacterized Fe-S cluster protein YjdI